MGSGGSGEEKYIRFYKGVLCWYTSRLLLRKEGMGGEGPRGERDR